MSRKKKLAILASCMVMCSAGFASVAGAEEAKSDDDIVLEEVLVTAAAFKQLNPVKFTTITEEEIKAKGAQNAAEALKDVTGLQVTTNNTKGKAIAQFRGSDADNTKVYVDGVPLNPVGDGKVDLKAIPADNIAKIEIIKGAVPVIYGTDAPGGVIYITTKKAGQQMIKSLSITTGTDNDEKYFLAVGGQRGKVNYNFSFKTEETEGYTDHTRMEGDYYSGKLSWDFSPKASLTVFGSYSERQEELPNRINPETGAIVRNGGQSGVITGKNNYWLGTDNWEYDPIKNSYIGLNYSYKPNARNDVSLKFYRSGENSHLKADKWMLWNEGVNHTGNQFWDGTVKGWELQHTIKTSDANTVIWGYNYETRSFTERVSSPAIIALGPNPYYNGNYDYTGKSFYLQDVTQVNRKLSTSFGYRHYVIKDNSNLNTIGYNVSDPREEGQGSSDNPVFSFNYALSNRTNLHGSIGTSFRWPNAKERSGPGGIYGIPSVTWQEGTIWHGNGAGPNGLGKVSTYLDPEEAINRELGLGYEKHGFKADLTFFSKDITNMIKGHGFGHGHTQYYNIPHVDMQGYELEVNKKIRNGLNAFFNYTYTDAYDPLVKDQVRDFAPRKWSFGLNYAGADGVNANLAVNYIGPKISVFSNGNGNGDGENITMPTNLISQNIPGYYVVDLKISKSEANQDYYLRILNLFDKKYYTGCYLQAPGRYIEVGTTFKF